MSQLSGGGREEAEGQGAVLGLGSPPPPYLRRQQSSQEPMPIDVDEEPTPPVPIPVGTSSQSSSTGSSQGSGSGLDCPICLQSCIHPVELPCHHIFCFLCIKGVVTQGGGQPRCAICRQDVPTNVLTNPMLKDITQLYKSTTSVSGFLWYYEARGGGWWEYDERTMQELERSYNDGQASTQLLIAGHLYDIDFTQMIQARAGNPSLFRRIKRDIPRTDKKGIAGIRIGQSGNGNPNSGGTANPNAPQNSQGQGQGGGRRRGRGHRSGNHRNHSSGVVSTVQSVINAVAAGVSGPSILTTTAASASTLSPTGGNSVTFFIPNSNPTQSPNSSSNNGSSGSDHDSNDPDADVLTDTDSDEEDSLDDEEDEDMGFGPEDDSTEEEIDEFDVRDGARAPTSRSDRSTSSSNHNPQTPDPNDPTRSRSGSSSGRGGRRVSTQSTTPVDGFPYVFSPTPTTNDQQQQQNGIAAATSGNNGSSSNSRPPSALPTPISPTVANSASTAPNTHSNNNGNGTCIRVGQNLRILVDYDLTPPDEDEIL